MTTCDTADGAERVIIDPGPGVDPGLGEITTELVRDTETDQAPAWALRCDLDIHGAAVRGLAQYFGGLDVAALGRRLRFARVTEHAPDDSDEAMPAPYMAALGDDDVGRYEPHAPRPISRQIWDDALGAYTGPHAVTFDDPADAGHILALHTVGTYSHDRLAVKVWADTEAERAALMLEIERMAAPMAGYSGFRLRLGHYHGVIASYMARTQARLHEAVDITAGRWIAVFTFAVSLPQLRTYRRHRVDVRGITTAAVPR